MHYKCPKCSWDIEGQTQVMTQIMRHERMHSQKSQFDAGVNYCRNINILVILGYYYDKF